MTGFAKVITCDETASVGLSAADIFSAELLNVTEAGDTQRSKHTKPMKLLPVVGADTSKDFLYEGERQALLFCANVECDVKCKSLLVSRPANQGGLKNANSLRVR